MTLPGPRQPADPDRVNALAAYQPLHLDLARLVLGYPVHVIGAAPWIAFCLPEHDRALCARTPQERDRARIVHSQPPSDHRHLGSSKQAEVAGQPIGCSRATWLSPCGLDSNLCRSVTDEVISCRGSRRCTEPGRGRLGSRLRTTSESGSAPTAAATLSCTALRLLCRRCASVEDFAASFEGTLSAIGPTVSMCPPTTRLSRPNDLRRHVWPYVHVSRATRAAPARSSFGSGFPRR